MLAPTGVLAAWLGVVASAPASVVVEGECDEIGVLEERLQAAMPSPPASLGPVHLTVERHGVTYGGRLTFEVDGVGHERTLDAESCAALYEASALVVGLTVQPGGSVEPGSSEPVPEPEPPPEEPIPKPESVPELEPEADARSPSGSPPLEPTRDVEPTSSPAEPSPGLGGRVQLGGGMALGVLHLAHPMVTGGVELFGRRWAAGLDAIYLPPLSSSVAPDVRVVLQMVGASARGCAVWRLAAERLALPLCAGVAVGRTAGRGEGAAIEGRRGQQTWVAAQVGPRARLRSRWGGELWLSTDLVVPLRRLNFVIDEVGTACCEFPLGAMLSIGAGFFGPAERN